MPSALVAIPEAGLEVPIKLMGILGKILMMVLSISLGVPKQLINLPLDLPLMITKSIPKIANLPALFQLKNIEPMMKTLVKNPLVQTTLQKMKEIQSQIGPMIVENVKAAVVQLTPLYFKLRSASQEAIIKCVLFTKQYVNPWVKAMLMNVWQQSKFLKGIAKIPTQMMPLKTKSE